MYILIIVMIMSVRVVMKKLLLCLKKMLLIKLISFDINMLQVKINSDKSSLSLIFYLQL